MVRRLVAITRGCAISLAVLFLFADCIKKNEEDPPDPAAERAKDGVPCATDADCRDGGACLHRICLGPACECRSSTGDILGIPTGTSRYCDGDCLEGWSCGVPAGHLPMADAGPQIRLRCTPNCGVAYPQDAAAGCPEGLSCREISGNAYAPTCVLSPPTAVIEGPAQPIASGTKITLTARDTSPYAPIVAYSWQRNTGGGSAEGATATFDVPESGLEFKATLRVHDTLGVVGLAVYEASICRAEGGNCSLAVDGGHPECCAGLYCSQEEDGCRKP